MTRELVDDRGLPPLVTLADTRAEGGRRQDDLVAEAHVDLLVLVVVGEGTHGLLKRQQRWEVARLVRQCVEQPNEGPVALGEQHVFLRGEVPEERAGRHVTGAGNVLDGDLVEAPRGELIERRTHELEAGSFLLALAEARFHHERPGSQPGSSDAM